METLQRKIQQAGVSLSNLDLANSVVETEEGQVQITIPPFEPATPSQGVTHYRVGDWVYVKTRWQGWKVKVSYGDKGDLDEEGEEVTVKVHMTDVGNVRNVKHYEFTLETAAPTDRLVLQRTSSRDLDTLSELMEVLARPLLDKAEMGTLLMSLANDTSMIADLIEDGKYVFET